MLLLKADENLSERGQHRLAGVFDTDDPSDKLKAAWQVKEQLRTLHRTGSLEDAAAAKTALGYVVERAALPETNTHYRTVCRWWAEIEVLIVTGATTARAEANKTAIKHIKRTTRGYWNPDKYKSRILLRSAARMAG
ncbi:transposase [Arthrobacter sp. CG_A4]|uniref:transposase n=1 Tax=Arthrobacter sp. CG_A4 TaxID=3071706 RepID=UPI002E0498F7|nr:transposase [Arthrobacter sp. CG_A4]